MKQVLFYSVAIVIAYIVTNCGGETASTNLVSTDLSTHNIPITIMAPEGAKIVSNPISLETGITVEKDNYVVDVDVLSEYKNENGSISEILEDEINVVKEDPDFKEITLQETAGFIYRTVNEEETEEFHFFYVVLKDDVQIEFREGLTLFKTISQSDATEMYNSVKQ